MCLEMDLFNDRFLVSPKLDKRVPAQKTEHQRLVKEAEEQRGRPPKLYVFRVVPYDVNVSVTEKPSEIMHGEDDIRNHVVKYYDYMYTGQNKDIINLEINFENRFLTPVSPDKGANQKDLTDHGAYATNRSHDENSNSQKPKEIKHLT